MIHINRAGSNLGIFSEEDVREGLRSGRFAANDLGWREGMASWQPLSQFPELSAETAGAAPPPVGAPPPLASITPVTASAARAGLPWDERHTRGFVPAFTETLSMVLLRPAEAFTAMKREGGYTEPLIYALVGACLGAIIAFLFSLMLEGAGVTFGHRNGLGALAGMGVSSIFFIVLIPFVILLGLFLGSAIVHVCLMVVGGANQSFETTFRVVAFTQGSTGVLQIVPVCGGLIAGIWALVVQIIGLARAHETDSGRAALAVFLPLIVCCGGGILLAIMFGALGALGHHNGF
ncbi:MAG: YIP1 family protein [Chthoniobacterales bacterium]